MTQDRPINIRKEQESDYQDVYKINALAFGGENESKLIEALRKSETFVPELSLVAEKEGKVVGHILFSKIHIGSNLTHKSLALAPVAVLPDTQKQGIGSLLIQFGLKKAAELGFGSVVVLGHSKYYPKFGFEPASNWNITTEYKDPESTFALELQPEALNGISGQVVYPPEFSVVS
ncbi:N-acetyltransferase [Patescibacteria group bacterium]|nr:N-acetyltransferase [Patescibacteria group bacterium]